MSPLDAADTTTTTIAAKISSPLITSLLSTHPNDVTLHDRALPSQWSSWWGWASSDTPECTPAWLRLVHYFMRPCGDDAAGVDIPPQLCSLVDSVRDLQLQRTPSGKSLAIFSEAWAMNSFSVLAYETRHASHRSYRISPKKEHEVDRMTSYIYRIVHSDSPRSVWHAVDVGSGQGYLSRALQDLNFDVLALDDNENQTTGANRWMTKEAARKLKRENNARLGGVKEPTESLQSHPGTKSTEQAEAEHLQPRISHSQTPNSARKGSLTHRTLHVCPRTLEESIAGWLIDHPGIQGHGDDIDDRRASGRPEPVPVTLVALHACGSLTIDVMRAFLANRARSPQTQHAECAWTPHSLVAVGCCYNLMSPSDFPLSKPLRDLDPVPRLTIAAVHLAAQVPAQWLKNQDAVRSAELALRKVVYRALLQPILQMATAQLGMDPMTFSVRPIQPGLGETMENRRLGKLNDKAYQDWPTFLDRATEKLGINLTAINTFPDWFAHDAARVRMENALFVLQTLRCLLGPLIETLILLDRRDWVQQELAEMNDGGREVEVEMINLFDQSTGSGRNVALVVKPTIMSEQSSI